MAPDRRWWNITKSRRDRYGEDVAGTLWGTIDRLRTWRTSEAMIDKIHEAIYLGRPIATAGRAASAQFLALSRSAPAVINVTQSKVDACTSRLTKRRPFPVISGDDSSWTERRFAKRASRAMRGRLGKTDIERMTPLVLRDDVIRGTGVAKVYAHDGDVAFDRVPRHELLVDPIEARYGTPRQMFQIKALPVEVVTAAFPEYKQQIENAISRDTDDWIYRQEYGVEASESSHVIVGEAWHLPSSTPRGKAAKHDGRRVMTVRGCVLADEPWARPRFPFAMAHWQPPVTGFWGRGLVETLAGPQAKINDVARDIQEALYYASQLVIFSPRSSNIKKEHLAGRHPRIVEYDGQLPTYEAPLPVSPQLFQFLEWLINICDDLSGLSRDYQAGRTQLGSNASGKAMDTLYDIQSDRFALVELAYSLFRVDLGALMIDAAREIAADRELPASSKAQWIRDLQWSKVDIDDGSYHLKLEPINFLPDTRAGKLSTVMEMAKAGLITDPLAILDLFEEPDIAAANRVALGPIHAIQSLLEDLDDPAVPLQEILPDPHWHLDLTMAFVQGNYCEAIASRPRAPERILERYRYTMKWTQKLIDKKLEAEQEKAAAGAGAGPVGASPVGPSAPPPAPPGAGGAMLPPGAAPPPMPTPLPQAA